VFESIGVRSKLSIADLVCFVILSPGLSGLSIFLSVRYTQQV
jgi:hypothetical protein